MGKERDTVASTRKTFSIVELLRERGKCNLSEIAAAVDMPKSTTHNHLSTLEELGYVVRDESEYELGLRFMSLGGRARNKRPEFRLVKEKVRKLADETGERVIFFVEEEGYYYYLHLEVGEDAVETGGNLGDRRANFHAGAAGKVLLAHMSEEKRRSILDRLELRQKTSETITDRRELEAELEQIRERQYALNRGELLAGLQAVAAPVMYDNSEIMGALCISGPAYRMSGERLEEALPDLLLGVANELELNINRPLEQ